jgi:hypothetical protein
MAPKVKKTYRKAVSPWMQIFIRFSSMDRLQLDVKGSDSIARVKTMIANAWHILENDQVIKFGGRELNDGKTLSDLNIQNLHILTMDVRQSSSPWVFA